MSKDKNNQKNDNNDCYTLLGVVKIMKIVVKTEGEQKWLKRKDFLKLQQAIKHLMIEYDIEAEMHGFLVKNEE